MSNPSKSEDEPVDTSSSFTTFTKPILDNFLPADASGSESESPDEEDPSNQVLSLDDLEQHELEDVTDDEEGEIEDDDDNNINNNYNEEEEDEDDDESEEGEGEESGNEHEEVIHFEDVENKETMEEDEGEGEEEDEDEEDEGEGDVKEEEEEEEGEKEEEDEEREDEKMMGESEEIDEKENNDDGEDEEEEDEEDRGKEEEEEEEKVNNQIKMEGNFNEEKENEEHEKEEEEEENDEEKENEEHEEEEEEENDEEKENEEHEEHEEEEEEKKEEEEEEKKVDDLVDDEEERKNSRVREAVLNLRNKRRGAPERAQALFKRAIEMEDDLVSLRTQYQDVLQEKVDLETRIEKKDKMIFDTSNQLEKAMGNMQNLREKIDKREKDLVNIQKENQMLQDLRHISSIRDERYSRVEGMRKDNPKRKISMDRMEKIIKLEDELKFKKNTLKNLEKEVKTVKLQLKRKDKAIEDLQREIQNKKKNEDESYKMECRNTELNYKVDSLKKEIRTLKQITRMKTKTIEQLNSQISSWQNLEESYNDAQKQLKTKQVTLKNLLCTLNKLKKENVNKQKEIVSIINERDDLPVRCLEEDKKYLKEQIINSQKKRTELDKTIKSQEKEIVVLKKRLEAVNVALRETKIGKLIKKKVNSIKAKKIKKDDPNVNFDTKNFVQKNLFLLLKKDSDLLRKKKENLLTLLKEKDSAIETLGQKIVSLKSTQKKEEKQQKIKLKRVKNRIKSLNEQLKSSEIEFRKKEHDLKAKIMNLKKKLAEAKESKKK